MWREVGPVRDLVDTWVPALSILGSLLLGGAAWFTARTGRKLGVSGREGEARRDTIADRDALYAAAVARAVGAEEREQHWRGRALAAEELLARWWDTAQLHAPWDWLAQEAARAAGKPLPPTPALRPEVREDDPT